MGGAGSRLELRECCFRSAGARVCVGAGLVTIILFFVRRVVVGRALGYIVG